MSGTGKLERNMMVRWLLAGLFVLLFSACGNPCDKLAKKVCKLKGKTSKSCKAAKKQIKKSSSKEAKMKCRAGLDLIKVMEEKKKNSE